SAHLLATREQISAHYAQYLDRVLTPKQRGLAAIYAWYAVTSIHEASSSRRSTEAV
ncbi:hypothetical protein A2U01_0074328, partial [Trifolium medium]|nr:hypothetical protein [Trifolium medium]